MRTLRFILALAFVLTARSVKAQNCIFTYAATNGFGSNSLLMNLNFTNGANELRLNSQVTPFKFINVPSSDDGTLMRIDVTTSNVVGEYRTAPSSKVSFPSRVAVDRYGNAWVANWDEAGEKDHTTNGSIARIGIVIGGTRGTVYKNGSGVVTNFVAGTNGQYLKPPFIYSTAVDRDGDGYIKTSRGLGNVLSWPTNSTGGVAGSVLNAEDECIINYVRVPAQLVCALAFDTNNDLWVGGYCNHSTPDIPGYDNCGNRLFVKVDGNTGQVLTNRVTFSTNGISYGGFEALVTPNGWLWTSGGGNSSLGTRSLAVYDPVSHVSDIITEYDPGNFGMAIDPQTKNVWITSFNGNNVAVLSQWWWNSITNYDHGDTYAGDLAIDGSGNVWVAHGPWSGNPTIGYLHTDGSGLTNITMSTAGCAANFRISTVTIDAYGKIWAICASDGNPPAPIFRIDPITKEPDLCLTFPNHGNREVYGDLTGEKVLAGTAPAGVWSLVCTNGSTNQNWSSIYWNGSGIDTNQVKVEVRASNKLATNQFQAVLNGGSLTNLSGTNLEIRVTVLQAGLTNVPGLHDLTVSCAAPAPVIVSPPTNAIVCSGSTAGFTVTATGGTPLSYQWRFNGGNLAGQTTSALNLSNVQTTNVGSYVVVVTNAYGSATSAQATLTLWTNALIVSGPVSNNVCPGQTAVFSVTAVGTSLNYQWYKGTSALSNQTSSTLTLTNVTASDAGLYSVAIWARCNDVTNYASLGVYELTVITNSPANLAVRPGTNATFTVGATGTGIAYQWFKGTNVLIGRTNSSLVLSNVSAADAGTYCVTVGGAGSCNSSNICAALDVLCLPSAYGLVGWWQAEGDGHDAIGGTEMEFHGTTFETGKVGEALWIGVGSYATVQSATNFDLGQGGGITVECWINPGDYYSASPLVNWGDGWGYEGVSFWVNDYSEGKLSVYLRDASHGTLHVFQSLPDVLTVGVYQHVAFTYDKTSGAAAIYVNGNAVGSTNFGSFTCQTAFPIFFGADPAHGYEDDGYFYYGLMDEIGIYSRALGSEEVRAIYDASNIGRCGIAPSILIQPITQSVTTSNSVTFRPRAGGTSPLGYQWFFNSNVLASATNVYLTIPNVQATNAGTYFLRVTNAFGVVTSSMAILTLHGASCSQAPTGLISWWRAETNGLDSVGTNNAAPINGAGYVFGRTGGGFGLDGTNQCFRIPWSQSLVPSNYTVEAWIKPAGPAGWQVLIFGQSYGFCQLLGRAGSDWGHVALSFGINPYVFYGVDSDIEIPVGEWSHIAGSWNGTTLKVYVNGYLSRTNIPGTLPVDSGCDFFIGGSYQTNGACGYVGQFFNGCIDEVGYYSRALSDAEIAANYDAGVAGKCQEAPVITAHPASQSTALGSNVTFTVTATGTPQLSYQWKFAGTNVPGATNTSLSLTNVQSANAGIYTAVVTNAFGSAVSSNAVLTISNPVPALQITNPVGQIISARTTNSVAAEVSVPGGSNMWVHFFAQGTNHLGYAYAPSNGTCHVDWKPLSGGTYILTAFATNNDGLSVWSAPVTNYVRSRPSVSISSPTDRATFLSPITNLLVRALAIPDAAVGISNVVFYGGTNFGVSNVLGSTNFGVGNIYEILWSNITIGTYFVSARAFDSNGGVSLSSNITFSVLTNRPPLVSAGSSQTTLLSSNQLELQGFVSDDGLPYGTLSAWWEAISGPTNVIFAVSNQALASVYLSVTGIYQLRLSASDGQFTVSSNLNITVLPSNLAPDVGAGTNQTITLPAVYQITNSTVGSVSSGGFRGNRGKEFWLGFPANHDIAMLNFFIASDTNTFGSISVPGIGFFTNFTLSAGTIAAVPIPAAAQVTTREQIEGKGIHIRSDNDIAVFGLSELTYTSDAYMGLPVKSLGTNYIVLGWKNSGMSSEFMIIGTAKNTTINIVQSANSVGDTHLAGAGYPITLNAGETYQVQSDTGDLSGTVVNSDKPIALLAGNQCAYVPECLSCDILVEQIPPTNSWGRIFYTMPLAGRNGGDVFQIIAATDQTSVWTNGVLAAINLNKGELCMFQLDSPSEIASDQPVLLAQYARGQVCDPGNLGGVYIDGMTYYADPFMMLIPPFEQFLTNYTISTPIVGFPFNYVNLVMRSDSRTNIHVTLDSSIINFTNFVAITNGWWGAQIAITNGAHTFASQTPFGLNVYGWGLADGYGYPGGMSLSAVADAKAISIEAKSATNTVDSTSIVYATVTDLGGHPVSGVRVDIAVTGVNSLNGVAYTGDDGRAQFAYIGNQVGPDTIYASAGTAADSATNIWVLPSFGLHGSVSDDGLPSGKTNLVWTQVGGPPVAGFSSTSALEPTVSVAEPGFYSFRLTADDGVLTNFADVGVSVLRNQPPVVDAGSNQIIKTASTMLRGSVVDDGLPNGELTTRWRVISGPGSVEFGDINAVVTTATFGVPGSYLLSLMGDDSQAVGYSEVMITVVVEPRRVQCGEAIEGDLASTSLHSITLPDSYADYYQFEGLSNHVLTVTMSSTNFDAYLVIRNSQLQVAAEADDSFDEMLGRTNSRIRYVMPSNDIYTIEATSALGHRTGTYTISYECSLPKWSGAILLASPSDGSVYSEVPASVYLSAYPSLASEVERVEFYTNATLLTTISNGPAYNINWSGVPAGAYLVTAVAYGRDAAQVMHSVTSYPATIYVGDPGYYVAILVPTNASVFPSIPAEISIQAAGFLDNDIGTMEFYANGDLLATEYAPGLPLNTCTYNWTNDQAGMYTLTAVASGVTSGGVWTSITSAPVVIQVGVSPPSISLEPSNACTGLLPGSAAINATLRDNLGAPTAGSITFSVAGANPTNVTLSTSPSGTVAFTLMATNAGRDVVTATATVAGQQTSSAVYRDWARPISCGQSAMSTLTASSSSSSRVGYADYYSFYGASNDVVVVTLQSTNFDAYLLLKDGNCNLVATNDDHDGTDSQIYFTLPATGRYVIEATSFQPWQTGAYGLSLACNPPPEGNGAPQLALLSTGQSLSNFSVVSFGATAVGSPISLELTLTNAGTAPLLLGPISVGGDFTVDGWPTGPIAAGSSADFTVQFNASSNVIENGQLGFANSDTTKSPFILNLNAVANIPGQPPSIILIEPTNNAVYPFGTNIAVVAQATAATNYAITNVQFVAKFEGHQVLLGSATNSPYTVTLAGLSPGTYWLFAVARDSAGRVSYSTPEIQVVVLPPDENHPPIARDDRFDVFANSRNNVRFPLLNDSDPDNEPLKIVAVTKPGGNGTVIIVNGGTAISYTPPWGVTSTDANGVVEPGDAFHYQVSDGKGGTAWGTISIGIFATAIPTVTITNPPPPYPRSAVAGADLPLIAGVTPYKYVTNVEFYIGETLIGVVTNGSNGVYTLPWSASYDACACPLVARAADAFGQQGVSAPIYIQVNPPVNGPGGTSIGPAAALAYYTGSAGAGGLTNGTVIRDGLFDVYGSAYHPLGSNDVVWQMGVYTRDGKTLLRDLTPKPVNVSRYHSGVVGSTNGPGVLAHNCDLTTLQNGSYILRLVVMGGLMITNTDVQFLLDTGLKLGQFSFSQQDLLIPVHGIPLSVSRTYSSINPRRGDFGYGWTWTLSDLQVELDEEREDAVGADASELEMPDTIFSRRTGGGRDVTLTLPDGRRTTFYFYLAPKGLVGTYTANWRSAPGITAKLELLPEVPNTLQTIVGNVPGDPDLYYWDATGIGVPMEAYDFPGWVLTTQDGTQYVIRRENLGLFDIEGRNLDEEQAWGKPYLQKIIERGGDTITFESEQMVYRNPAGGVIKEIVFQRDPTNGLIRAISDPIAQGTDGFPVVKYEYDGYDNLMNVLSLVDRSSGTYVTNTFLYTNDSYPHYITGIIDPRGILVARNEYDDDGRLTAVVDADGNRTEFSHNTDGKVEKVIDRLGHTNSYGYDFRGNVIATTNAVGAITLSSYDDNNNKTNQIEYVTEYPYSAPYATNRWVYSPDNLLLVTCNPLGYSNVFTYNTNGQIVTSTDARGHISTNYYDSVTGDLLGTSDALGNSTTNAYDPSTRLLLMSRDAIGTITTNNYDPASQNLLWTATFDGSGILSSNTFTYDENASQLSSTVWRRVNNVWTGSTTLYEYDGQGRVIHTINPDGGTNTVDYNEIGKQSQTIDPLGRSTRFAYDAQGRLTNTVYPDSSSESSGYDVSGNRVWSADRIHRVTTYVYDALNRLYQTVYPDNTTNTTVYDDLGRVRFTVDAGGTVTAPGYDRAGQRVAVTNAWGTSIAMTNGFGFDANGNQVTSTDALGRTTISVYDDLNRMIQTVYADGTTSFTGYDVAGRRVAETNQDSVVTRFGYDGAGRLIAVTNAFGTGQQMVTQYHYDEAGNQIDQVDALGHTTTFAYDAMGRRIKRTLPGTQAETMGYDLAGNLRFTTNFNGVIITNQYDVMNRLTNRSSINGYQVTFTYAPTGQRETMVDSTGVTTSIYDARDRLVTKSVDWPGYGESVSLHYVYDESGRVTDISSSTFNGVRLHYDYDPLGRLTNVLSRGWASAGYGFDGVGNLQSIRYGNGVTNRYDYDSMNRLTNLVWKAGTTPLASFYYQLGKTGNRTNLVENVNTTERTNMWQYDALYRMTNETIVGLGSLGYALDKVGNRLTRTSSGSLTGTLPATTATFTANDWLNTDIYDSNGNTLWSATGASGTNYYDVENRLTNFNDGAVLLEYNGDGTRTKKVLPNDSSSNPVHYLVDDRNPTGYPQVLEEHWGNSGARGVSNVFAYGLTLIAQQDWSANVPVASYYFVSDGHGSTRLLLDTNAAIVGTFLYDAYGNLVVSNATVSTKYLYCGEQFDSELGMYYLRARYYRPETGRFWTMDSFEGHQETPQHLHKYAYSSADPIDRTDPTGRESIEDFIYLFDAISGFFHSSSAPAAPAPGKGGPDVTKALNQTLANVSMAFSGWSSDDKFFSALSLKDLVGNDKNNAGGRGAWDIYELHFGAESGAANYFDTIPDKKRYTLGNGSWKHTVTFNSKCYYAHAVNYAIFGRMYRLLNDYFETARPFSFPSSDGGLRYPYDYFGLGYAISAAKAWKHLHNDDYGPGAQQAIEFVKYGYNGTSPSSALPCSWDGETVSAASFRWHWDPKHPGGL